MGTANCTGVALDGSRRVAHDGKGMAGKTGCLRRVVLRGGARSCGGGGGPGGVCMRDLRGVSVCPIKGIDDRAINRKLTGTRDGAQVALGCGAKIRKVVSQCVLLLILSSL
jgi:hypothetical protein